MAIKKNITEAKAQFSQIIVRVERGGEVIISRGGKPVARIIPFDYGDVKRTPDKLKGKLKISEDFDDCDSEIESLFALGE